MRAWILESLGGLDRLKLADAPDPRPAAGEVVLDVRVASLNPADRYLSEGQYPARPPMPHILGRDGVGRVSGLGPGVRDFDVGDDALILRSEIGVSRPGTFAERVAVPVESLVRVPVGWTPEEAAAGPLVYLTAYQALTQWGDLSPSVVLITGASGGVGVASVQLGRALGHTIVALSRSDEKQRTLRELGANVTLDPNDPTWRKSLKAALGDRKVDLAIDNIGGPLFSDVIDTLGMWGKVSVVGRLAGPVPNFNTATLFFRRLRVGGVAVGTYTPAESQQAWSAVLELLAKVNAKPVVDRVFPFEQVRPAFDRLAEGPMGKVLLQVRPT